MDWKKLALGVLLGSTLAVTGCGDDDGGTDGGGTDATTDSGGGGTPLPGECADGECIFVVNELAIPDVTVMGGVETTQGFNIDGRVSDDTDAQGCFQPDFTSPDGREGIDNQLATLKPTLAGFIGDLDMTISDALADGSVILLMELTGAESTDDSDVGLNLYLGEVPGGGAPMLADGKIAAGQTFDINPASVDSSGNPLVSVPASTVGGRVTAGPLDLPLTLAVDASTSITLNIRNASVQATVGDGTLTDGIIGGELNIDELVAIATGLGGGVDEGTIRTVLEPIADLNPNGDMVCQSVSVGLTFAGVDAIKGAIASPPPDMDAGTADAGPGDAGAADAGVGDGG